MSVRTIKLYDEKYEFDLDGYGLMVAARRNGEDWPAGFELRFTKCFMAALSHIVDLEDELANTSRWTGSPVGSSVRSRIKQPACSRCGEVPCFCEPQTY